MEIIKKTIKQVMITGTTVPCTYRNPETGEIFSCTGTCYVIIRDSSPTHYTNIKFCLTQEADDIGFLDAYQPVPATTDWDLNNNTTTGGGGSNPVLPTVTTDAIVRIVLDFNYWRADGGGNVTSSGGANVTERGVVWSTLPTPTKANNIYMNSDVGTGIFLSNIHTLAFTTKYYVRAFATNSAGTAYGNEVNFTTPATEQFDPTVNGTTNVTAIVGTTATSGGFILSSGTLPVTASGIVWDIDDGNPGTTMLPGKGNTSDGPTGEISALSFSSNLSGLIPNTKYRVKAWARNNVGTAYDTFGQTFTAGVAQTSVEASVTRTIYHDGSSGNGCIKLTPALTGAQSVTLSFVYDQVAIGSGSKSEITILCKTAGTVDWVNINNVLDPTCSLTVYEGSNYGDNNIIMNANDAICYTFQVQDGTTGTCSSFTISPASSTDDVYLTASSTYNPNKLIIS